MKKDLLLSLAAIEAVPKRSEGIADSAVQMFNIDLLLMLQKKKFLWLVGTPTIKTKNRSLQKMKIAVFKISIIKIKLAALLA
jgi:hypothetical protein